MPIRFRGVLLPVLLCTSCWAQSHAAGNAQQMLANNVGKGMTEPRSLRLVPAETILAPTEVAKGFTELSCDAAGNLYLGSDSPATPGIRKLGPRGELLATFAPTDNPDIKVGGGSSFAVSQNGDLYFVASAKNEISRYVLVFKSDGTYKNKIKLQPGFAWVPASIGVFPNGTLLMTGQEYVKGEPMAPFTGIFSADGTLRKEIDLEDDKVIDEMARLGDSRVTSPVNPSSNRAVSWGRMQAASDGNIYVMRWLSPAVFYAISPGGKVVRRFIVDSGRDDLMPMQMHISGDRIAVLFVQHESFERIMKVVDLEGHEIATYDYDTGNYGVSGSNVAHLGLAFACYTAKPERFTFLTTTDDHRIQLQLAEGR
jgi:hypothetical protein